MKTVSELFCRAKAAMYALRGKKFYLIERNGKWRLIEPCEKCVAVRGEQTK